jgi:hypothetical protein
MMETASRDELSFGTDLGMIRTGCTEVLWRKFKNKSEGGEQGARGASPSSSYNGLRREIGR